MKSAESLAFSLPLVFPAGSGMIENDGDDLGPIRSGKRQVTAIGSARQLTPGERASLVRHAGDRRGTIESKVAGVLRALHAKEQDRLSRAVLANWSPARPPVVAILAATYSSGGLSELKQLFQARSTEWLFDYRIWRWTGCRVEELEHRDLVPPRDQKAYDALKIERLIGGQKRAPSRSVAELRSMAQERGVGQLLDHALQLAAEVGFRRTTTRGNLNLLWPNPGGKWDNVVGFYITGSARDVGLKVGIWREKLGLHKRDLPGQPAPRMGFLNTNRYVRTAEELTSLLNLFRSS